MTHHNHRIKKSIAERHAAKTYFGSHAEGEVVAIDGTHFHFQGEKAKELADRFSENLNHPIHHISIESAKTYFGSHTSGTVVIVAGVPNHFQDDKTHYADAVQFIATLDIEEFVKPFPAVTTVSAKPC